MVLPPRMLSGLPLELPLALPLELPPQGVLLTKTVALTLVEQGALVAQLRALPHLMLVQLPA